MGWEVGQSHWLRFSWRDHVSQPLSASAICFCKFFFLYFWEPNHKIKKLWLLKGFPRKLIQKECFWDLIYFTRSLQRDVCGIAVAIITKRMRNSHNGEEVRHKSIAQQRQVSLCCAMAQSMVWTRCWTWWDIKMWDKKEDVFFIYFFNCVFRLIQGSRLQSKVA